MKCGTAHCQINGSLSARRAWIEIGTAKGVQGQLRVALRKESVDRNTENAVLFLMTAGVALRKESVDRNIKGSPYLQIGRQSLSARRAWIEIYRWPHHAKGPGVALRKESVDRNGGIT